ncbi:MAG: hypothetical protein ACFFCQ_09985 [Promethearchaeota archaeon]
MSDFSAFEIMIYICVAVLIAFSYKKKGSNILFYFPIVLLIVIYAEAPNMGDSYEYKGFGVRLWKVPLAIGLGWALICLTCYFLTDFLMNVEQWNPQKSFITLRGKKISFYPALALLDGFFVFMMSLVAEVHGAQVEVWIYNNSQTIGDFWLLNVHIRTLWTYGAAAFVFNFVLRLVDPFLKNQYLGKLEIIPFIIFIVCIFGYFAFSAILDGEWAYLTLDCAIGGFVIVLSFMHHFSKRVTSKS